MVVGSLTDATGKNLTVVPAGGFVLIPIAVKETSTGNPVPLDAAWNTQDPLFTVTDPDGGALTWNTNTLDPGDPDDDFDADRSTYVGDQFTPEIPGLHAILDGTTGTPVRLAIKLQAPTAAEQTTNNSSRAYQIEWFLLKNGSLVADVTEAFNVGPQAIPVFSDITVTWAEVTALISSSVTDTVQQDAILLDGSEEIRAAIEDCGIDPDSLPVGIGNRSIKRAIIKYLRASLMVLDTSSGLLPSEVREGLDTLKGLRPSDSAIAKMQSDALATIERWCRRAKAGSFFAYGVSGHAEDVF